MAVHVSGSLGPGRMPLVCVPGYNRNMSDFADLLRLLQFGTGGTQPIVLVDLKGRGRSTDRTSSSGYSSITDAADLVEVLRALAVERAIFVGQGYGGQVLMALAASRPSLIAGCVLIDSGPVSDSRGLVRLRNTLNDLVGVHGAGQSPPDAPPHDGSGLSRCDRVPARRPGDAHATTSMDADGCSRCSIPR